MRFNINLVTKTYLDDLRIQRWGTFVILILVSFLAWNVYRVSWSAGSLKKVSSDISELETGFAMRPVGVSEKEFTALASKIGFYNGIIRKKSYNWLYLLDQLEQVTPEGIAISSLKPDLKEQLLKIEGRARNFKLIQNYLEKLNDSKFFSSVLLQSHVSEKNGDSVKGFQFVITCKAALP